MRFISHRPFLLKKDKHTKLGQAESSRFGVKNCLNHHNVPDTVVALNVHLVKSVRRRADFLTGIGHFGHNTPLDLKHNTNLGFTGHSHVMEVARTFIYWLQGQFR